MPHPRKKNKRLGYLLTLTGTSLMLIISINASCQETDTIFEKTGSDHQTKTETIKTEFFLKRADSSADNLTFNERHVPDNTNRKMQESDDFWYANALLKKTKRKQSSNSYVPVIQREWFQTLLWIVIVICFVSVIIWYLSESNISIFRKKDVYIREESSEMNTGDIFAINFQKEIDKAIQQGEFRLAVRLMFLRLLKDLSEKNIIQYTQDKTNFDYLSQLHQTRYYNDFFRLTRNYEFSWYGHFDVDENAFRVIQREFNLFNRQFKL